MQRNARWLQASGNCRQKKRKKNELTSKYMKSVNVNELNDELRSKLIDSHRKQLLQEVHYIGKHQYNHT